MIRDGVGRCRKPGGRGMLLVDHGGLTSRRSVPGFGLFPHYVVVVLRLEAEPENLLVV